MVVGIVLFFNKTITEMHAYWSHAKPGVPAYFSSKKKKEGFGGGISTLSTKNALF